MQYISTNISHVRWKKVYALPCSSVIIIVIFVYFSSWVSSLLHLGHKRPLEIDDIFDILPDDQSTPWTDRLEE